LTPTELKMKGFVALVLLGFLCLSAYNVYEIRTLKQEIETLNQKVTAQSQTGLTDEVVAKAAVALAQARDAMNHMDTTQARNAYDTARRRLDEAARIASDKAGPTVKWLRDETADLGKQLQDKIHGH
jgi:hypothetical protein